MRLTVVFSIVFSMLLNFLAPRVDLGGDCRAAFDQVVNRNAVVSCVFSMQDISVLLVKMLLHCKADRLPDTKSKTKPTKSNSKSSEFSIILDKYKICIQNAIVQVFDECALPNVCSLRLILCCFVLQTVHSGLPSSCRSVAYFARSDTSDIAAFGTIFRLNIANPVL